MRPLNMSWRTYALAIILVVTSGCATYTTPGAGVSIPNLAKADADIAELMKAEPAAAFPARMALVRVQAAGYRSDTNQCYGSGRYCVVTTRDIETEDHLARLGKMPQLAGLAPITRLLLPPALGSLKDLRLAAAPLKADILMVYTLDTGFKIGGASLGPLSLVTLGFLPNKQAKVSTTASAVFFDVRTEFVYGTAEATATEEHWATIWSTQTAIDSARISTEKSAFDRLVGEIEKVWVNIVKAHARSET